MNVGELVEWHATQSPELAALSLAGREKDVVSYFRLHRAVCSVGKNLVEQGISANSTYVIWVQDTLLHIAVILALDRLGAASVSATSLDVAIKLQPATIITDQPNLVGLEKVVYAQPSWLSAETAFSFKQRPFDANEICRVILTSGSTGEHKGSIFTRAILDNRLSSYRYAFGSLFATHSRVLCCMGLASSLGYLMLMHVLSRGGMYCVPFPSLEVTLRNAHLYSVECLIAAPATLAEFTEVNNQPNFCWPSLELILTAGSSLPKPLANAVRQRLCSRIMTFYGTTEAGIIAAGLADSLDLASGEVGRVVPGVEVRIEDDSTGSGAGLIKVSNDGNIAPYATAGQLNELKPDPKSFSPGDIGFVSGRGMVSVLGRADNVVNLGGIKTTVELIEGYYFDAPGTKDRAVALITDKMGLTRIICVVVPGEKWSEAAFKGWYAGRIKQPFWPDRILILEAIPRKAAKVDRIALARMVKSSVSE